MDFILRLATSVGMVVLVLVAGVTIILALFVGLPKLLEWLCLVGFNAFSDRAEKARAEALGRERAEKAEKWRRQDMDARNRAWLAERIARRLSEAGLWHETRYPETQYRNLRDVAGKILVDILG